MDILRHAVAILLLLLAVHVVVVNWACVGLTVWNKARGVDRRHSLVPVVSLLLVAVAWLVSPWTARSRMFWVPAVDIGTWLVVWIPIVVFRERRR